MNIATTKYRFRPGAASLRSWRLVPVWLVILALATVACSSEPEPTPEPEPKVPVTCEDGTTEWLPDGDEDDVPDEPACDQDSVLFDCDPQDPTVGYPILGYPDADEDGYTLPEAKPLCPADGASRDIRNAESDCDDSDPAIHPGADEICDDGIDQDCSGADLSCSEVDGDGDGYAASEGDCDDADPSVNPDASETCNGQDDDCDGSVDEDVLTTYHLDYDGDGYGDAALSTQACDPPPYYTTNGEDCDDTDPEVNPGAPEICNDGLDNDCDGDGCLLSQTVDLSAADAKLVGEQVGDHAVK